MKKNITLMIVLVLVLSLSVGFTGNNDVNEVQDFETEQAYVQSIMSLEVNKIDKNITEIQALDIRGTVASAKVTLDDGNDYIFNFQKTNNTWELISIK
jgi:hypothetical protein